MTADAVFGFSSIAGNLEPLAGVAVAVNLAYLGLTRFRYRDHIRKTAEQERKVFEPAERPAPENIRRMKYYKELCDLCYLSNYDIDEIKNADKRAKVNGSVWSHIYNILYRRHFDRYTTYFFAGISGLTIVSGVANNVDTLRYLQWLFHPYLGSVWLYLLTAACCAPVGFVWMGRKIVYYASQHAKDCREQIELAMQSVLPNEVVNLTGPQIVVNLDAAANGS